MTDLNSYCHSFIPHVACWNFAGTFTMMLHQINWQLYRVSPCITTLLMLGDIQSKK